MTEGKLQKISERIWENLVIHPEMVYVQQEKLRVIKALISELAPSFTSQEFALFSKILNKPTIVLELAEGRVNVLASSLYPHSACVKRWLTDQEILEEIVLTGHSTRTFDHFLSFCRGNSLDNLTLAGAWNLNCLADYLEATEVTNFCHRQVLAKISEINVDDFESIEMLVEISRSSILDIPALTEVKKVLEGKMSETVQSFINGRSSDEAKSEEIFKLIETEYKGPLKVSISVWPSAKAERVFRLNVVDLELVGLVGSLALFEFLPESILEIRFIACILDPSGLCEKEMKDLTRFLERRLIVSLVGKENIVQEIKDQYEAKSASDTQHIARLQKLKFLHLEESIMGNRFYRNLPQTLETIDVNGSSGEQVLFETFPPDLPKLPRLTRCCIDQLSENTLMNLPETIQHIETYLTSWETEAVAPLQHMNDLRILKFMRCTVTREVIESLPSGLEELSLRSANHEAFDWMEPSDIADFTDALIKMMNSMNRLRSLDLSGCFIDVDRIIPCLPDTLEDLDLEDIELTEVSAASFSRLTQLRRLILSGNSITGEIISHLPESIEDLNLTKTELTDAIAASFSRLTQLRRLTLSWNSITREMISHLPDSIEDLDLNTTRLTEDCARSLSRFTRLRRLDLSHINVNSEFISHLPDTLQYLKLFNTSVDQAALVKISRMRNLEELVLPTQLFGFRDILAVGRSKSFRIRCPGL